MRVTEKDIESYAVRQAKKLDIWTRKFSSPAQRGVPDRIFIARGIVWFVEFKAPDGRLTKLQLHELGLIQRHGGNTMMLNTKEDVDAFLGLLASRSSLCSTAVPDHELTTEAT